MRENLKLTIIMIRQPFIISGKGATMKPSWNHGLDIYKQKRFWYRLCSSCNGVLLKGEGKIVGKCKSDYTVFWIHKEQESCKNPSNWERTVAARAKLKR